jgi:linoleoyl-CoA desaturase
MARPALRFKKIKYEQKDSSDLLFTALKKKQLLYFSLNHISRYGNWSLLFKALTLLAIIATSYYSVLTAGSYLFLQVSYLILGAACVITGMNIGHDAAHNCLTGNKKVDDTLFEIIFGLQGINGYLWKIRHNHSHHPFPNVHNLDSDLEITNIFYLSPNQRKKRIHYYQHLYAPIVYMFMSLLWIFYLDFRLFCKTKLANLESMEHHRIEAIKLVLYKISSITIFLVFPLLFSPLPASVILFSFIVMHLLTSMALTFIFFISHHVMEITYNLPDKNVIHTSWVEQQINATMDFHAESKIANFIFGGFNAHLAHHLFPDVCHIHYPILTSLIKQTLAEHRVKYNSLSFLRALRSHLTLLKHLPRTSQIHG